MEVEIDVEVASGVEFVRDGDRRIFQSDVLLAFVPEETREGLIHGAGKFCFVGFLVVRDRPFFPREFWVGDVFLPDVRRGCR